MNIVEAFVYGIPRVSSEDGTFMTVGTGKPGVVAISDLTVHRPIVELVHPAQIKFMESDNISSRQSAFIIYVIDEMHKMQIIRKPHPYGSKIDLLKRLPLKHGPAKKGGGLTFAQMKGCFYAGAKQRH